MVQEYDILLYKGSNIFSRSIKRFTKSKYSHVAIVLDKYHIVEINFNYKLSIRHLNYRKRKYDIYRVKNLTDNNKQLISEYIQNNLKTEYDFKEIVRILLPFLYLKDNNKRLICSEFVYDCFNYAGIQLVSKDSVTPEDIADSTLLTLIKT